ncbi:zf-HC2 domain-containing protein [Sphaerisporangium sp. NPDC051017]|uniref:anti-sigma factor family protein n=1 Tax=Sphaerisporangium sp. NPDC051017 TaxID=3154636 RepID=UPI00343AF4A7
MSHLGERASALMDGELGHAERERALAHLTFCADCRAELDSIRALKSRLRSLDPPAVPADLTMSLLRMAEPGGPIPPRVRPFPSTTYAMTSPSDNRPRRGGGFSGPGRAQGGRRAGYVAVGVASAAVALGTLFMVGGTGDRPASPPVEMFANQHRTSTSPPVGGLVPGRGGTISRQP